MNTLKRVWLVGVVLAAIGAFAYEPTNESSKFVYRGSLNSVNTNASLILSNMGGALVHVDCHTDGGGVPMSVDMYVSTGYSDGSVTGTSVTSMSQLFLTADSGYSSDGGNYGLYSPGCKQLDSGTPNPCPLTRFTQGRTFTQRAAFSEDTVWVFNPDAGICDIYTAVN